MVFCMEKEQEADAFYEEQLKKKEPIMEKEDTGRTVAFFLYHGERSGQCPQAE